jgi:hypothetical protein
MPRSTDKTPPSNNGTNSNGGGGNSGGSQPVSFTLDGQPFTLPESKQDAGNLLRLGGLDVAEFDLTVLRNGNAPVKPYGDDQQVHIKDGDVFLSVRRSAQVA